MPEAATDRSYIHPRAGWQLTLDGKDLTASFDPRLLSVRLSEKRGEEADELEIVVHDADGALAVPPEGARLRLSLGWQRGSAVPLGMVDKGLFKVDEVSAEGGQNGVDRLTIKARSADLADSYRQRRNRMWQQTTVGAVISKIAADHGYTAACHASLASKPVKAMEQANKSDMTLLRDLGRRHDAVATVKNRSLVFAPIGAGTSAGGQALPAATIARQQTVSHAWRRAAREGAQQGAEAQWHDQDQAGRKTSQTGGGKRRRTKRVYASQQDAKDVAEAESKRLKRAAASLDLTLSLGDPALAPETRVTVNGFKGEIDGTTWLIASAEHAMDGSGGLTTTLQMEVAG